MIKLYSVFIAVIITARVFAQAPEKMSYQAVVRNSSNQLVTGQIVGMRISILQGSATGAAVYVETQTPTTNSNGLTTIEIGSGTVVSGTFSSISWSSDTYFIKIETDPTGGTSYSITGTSQLLSVPYALYAKTAGNGFSGNYNDLTNKPNGNNSGDIQYWNGTAWTILPIGTTGQVLTITSEGKYVWVNQYLCSKATTSAATAITTTTSTLNGSVNANGFSTIITFEYGTTAAYGNTATATQSPVTGNMSTSVSMAITGLTAGTTYHYRVKAVNSLGITYGNDMVFTTTAASFWIDSQTSWLDATQTNTIMDAINLLDNNSSTNGYLSMSYYSTTYTKVVYLNFGTPKTVDGFKFTFEFPNCLQGKCSSYPTDIDYNCLGNLYYKNANNQWVSAYTCPKLNTKISNQGCPMSDTYTTTFSEISAKEWKFEMVGNYWLGGSFQTTTNYRVKDINFRTK